MHEENEDGEEGSEEELANGGGGDLMGAGDNVVDPVEDRRTLAERNERLHDQLKVSLSHLLCCNYGEPVGL